MFVLQFYFIPAKTIVLLPKIILNQILIEETSTPEEQNLSSKTLSSLVNAVNNGSYGQMKSLLIVRNNYLVLEKYFNGVDRDQLHILYSVTKSITSIATGIAIAKEHNFTTEDKIKNYFPEYLSDFDSLKGLITIKNLLTMTSGLQWNELSISYSDSNNDFNKLFESNDEIGYSLQKNCVNTPDTKFTYNTGLPLLQAVILRKSTGILSSGFINQNLLTPLGITKWSWYFFPDSLTNTASGLSLRPVDLALIGQLI